MFPFEVHSEVPVLHYRGFVQLQDQMYLIEPLAGAEAGQQDDRQSSEDHSDEGLHAVYNYKHLRRKRSSCSHGNTTTFYDHGARPSGLFQLGSLVKTHSADTHRFTPGFEVYSSSETQSFFAAFLHFTILDKKQEKGRALLLTINYHDTQFCVIIILYLHQIMKKKTLSP